MANPNSTAQVAKVAAREDAPAKAKPALTDAQRASRASAQLDARIRGLEYRTTQVCKFLVDMGVSSLAGQVQRYSDVPLPIRQAALAEVEKRVEVVRSALKAASAQTVSATAKVGVSLRGAVGTPAVGQ